jgi:formyltetrahydrofolate synthetase
MSKRAPGLRPGAFLFRKVAKKVNHASEVVADTAVRKKIEKFQEDGFGNLRICIAKTQYSFSTDPQLRGAPEGHVFNVRDDGRQRCHFRAPSQIKSRP